MEGTAVRGGAQYAAFLLTPIGVAFRKVSGPLYPAVSLHSPGETIIANFGQRHFRFDLESYIQVADKLLLEEVLFC